MMCQYNDSVRHYIVKGCKGGLTQLGRSSACKVLAKGGLVPVVGGHDY